jgi:hypothetical protein
VLTVLTKANCRLMDQLALSVSVDNLIIGWIDEVSLPTCQLMRFMFWGGSEH